MNVVARVMRTDAASFVGIVGSTYRYPRPIPARQFERNGYLRLYKLSNLRRPLVSIVLRDQAHAQLPTGSLNLAESLSRFPKTSQVRIGRQCE